MSTNTFANSCEICSKAASGASMAAFPDVCFTPPLNPAGTELPLPYPNSALASNLDKGSTKVLICNKMAALEDSAYIKTSTGDEAAKPSTMKGGVITHTTQGKAYFINWSSDVKFEGKGVARFKDMTTHNHASAPGQTPPQAYMDAMLMAEKCKSDVETIQNECKEHAVSGDTSEETTFSFNKTTVCAGLKHLPRSYKQDAKSKSVMTALVEAAGGMEALEKLASSKFYKSLSGQAALAMAVAANKNTCLAALRCVLHSYADTDNSKPDDKKPALTCCQGQSGHHIIPQTMLEKTNCKKFSSHASAPVVCVEGVNNTHGTHGMIHRNLKRLIQQSDPPATCKDMAALAAASLSTLSACNPDCTQQQIEKDSDNACSSCTGPKTLSDDMSGFSGAVDAKIETFA